MNAIHGKAGIMAILIHGLMGCPHHGHRTGAPTEPPPGTGAMARPDSEPLHEGVGPAGPAPNRHHHAHDRMNHRFDDAERWALTFDAPERDAWQLPEQVVAATLGKLARAGLRVADIGAGTGYFTLRLARAVPEGTVVAVDIESSLLQWIEERALSAGLKNILTHRLTETAFDWPPALGRTDVVFMCNTYHHVASRVSWFHAVREASAANARLVIVDFRPESPRGPPLHHKIEAATVVAELAEAGWKMVEQHDFLPDQYMLVFQPTP